MKINKMTNNSITPSFRANEEEAKKFVKEFNNLKNEFKKNKDPQVEAARKRLMDGKGTDADKILVDNYIAKLTAIEDKLKQATDDFTKKGKPELDKLPSWIKTIYQKYSKTWLVRVLSEQGAKGLTIALAAGNVLKEIVGGVFYTIQAMTNEDLPKDKRKFVGMYDLIVSAISSSFSAAFGIIAITCQDRFLGNRLKRYDNSKFSKYAAAYAGLTFLIPTFLQTIIGKRIIAPAIATPVAGRWKEKQLAKLEAEKAKNNNNEQNKQAELNTVSDLKFTDKGYIDLKAVVEDEKLAKKNANENEKSLATA